MSYQKPSNMMNNNQSKQDEDKSKSLISNYEEDETIHQIKSKKNMNEITPSNPSNY